MTITMNKAQEVLEVVRSHVQDIIPRERLSIRESDHESFLIVADEGMSRDHTIFAFPNDADVCDISRDMPAGLDWGNVSIGSIPACAGEPRASSSPSSVSPVYPRVCGGTPMYASTRSASETLSPRVRGNPGQVVG